MFFSQIFCNCLNEDEILSYHNKAFSLSQNVKQKFGKSVDKRKSSGQKHFNRDFLYKNLTQGS